MTPRPVRVELPQATPAHPGRSPGGRGDRRLGSLEEDIFGEEFLLTRPCSKRFGERPGRVVDRRSRPCGTRDRALLLEILSEYQVSIPELGTCGQADSDGLSHVEQHASSPRPSSALSLPLHWLPTVERERDIIVRACRASRRPWRTDRQSCGRCARSISRRRLGR